MSGDRTVLLARRPGPRLPIRRQEDEFVARRKVAPSVGGAAALVTSLQRTVGNQAVVQLMREGGGPVQRLSFGGIGKAIKKAFGGRASERSKQASDDRDIKAWLYDPKRYPYFKAYCLKTWNHEMIHFLEAVADYKRGGQSMTYARAIYMKYVAEKAPEELNITKPERDRVAAEFESGKRPVMPIDLFDEIVKHVEHDLGQVLGRFLEDKEEGSLYQAYLKRKPVPA